MSLKIFSKKKNTAAEIVCDLSVINRKDLADIKKALSQFGMVYFRNQNLTSSQYLAFAKKMGKPALYPRLKGLSKKFPEITVVQRKKKDKGPSFGEQFHTDSSYTKKPPKFTMLLSKLVPKKGLANTEFSSQYLAYENLPKKYKSQINKLKGTFSSKGPIAITTVERVKEKGKLSKELKANHKIIRNIGKKKSIYFSAGHFIGFGKNKNNKLKELEKFLKKHQIKKKFQFSLEWEKNQLAIRGNRSMLHQATPFNGNRIMHRITIK